MAWRRALRYDITTKRISWTLRMASGGFRSKRSSCCWCGRGTIVTLLRRCSGATLEAAAVECGTEHIDEWCDGLAGLTVDDALQCSLEMKKTHEYFSSSCGAGALDIKAPYRRRASCDHSDKAVFDDA